MSGNRQNNDESVCRMVGQEWGSGGSFRSNKTRERGGRRKKMTEN